ncbi:radical SAM protein, partial [Streptomyces sp. SID7982]|nr:radical SAM protein [Streptomyces sp. SID7982]
ESLPLYDVFAGGVLERIPAAYGAGTPPDGIVVPNPSRRALPLLEP